MSGFVAFANSRGVNTRTRARRFGVIYVLAVGTKKSTRVQTNSSTPGQREPGSNPKDDQEEHSGAGAGWGQGSEACVLEDTWPLLVWALIWASSDLCASMTQLIFLEDAGASVVESAHRYTNPFTGCIKP